VDGSGTLAMVDALLAARCVLELINCAAFNEAAIDVDCSGTTTMVDALLIARRVLDLIVAFPC